jgi:predicted Zn-dependent protease
MDTNRDIAERVLDLVGADGDAEVRVHTGTSSLTRFANSFIHQNVGEEGSTVSLRMAVDGRVASGTTTNLGGDGLRRFVAATIEAARVQPVDPDWPGLVAPTAVPAVDHFDPATAAASPDERASRVKAFVDAAPDLSAAGYCETAGVEIAFANSAGHQASGRHSQAMLDGIQQTPTSAGSGHAAAARLADLDAKATGALAARRALDSVTVFDTKPGEYEVVLAPECVATIAVFLGVYGFNAKSALEGQSFARVGETQFDERVTLVDDVTDSRALGVGFDSEGTPKRRVPLIDRGVTRSLVHDRRTARKADVASTGSATPHSDVWGPMPSALFVKGGDDLVDDMIAAVERGIYVATFNYCRVLDPKSLVVTGLTRNGTFMIENGKITGAVSNLRFTQSFVTALGAGQVLGVGDDARLGDSEFGPGIAFVPTLRLAGWNFTGGTDG